MGYERIFRTEKEQKFSSGKTSVLFITEFALSQTGENYLRVTKWREIKDESGTQKSKVKENQYQRIGADKVNEINKKRFISDPWEQDEKKVSWQGKYKVIVHKDCELNIPLFCKVIKTDGSRLYYELRQ